MPPYSVLKHALHVFVTEGAGITSGPSRHFLNHVERLLVAAIDVHVEQSGHDLVNGVEGRPHSLALAQAIEEFDREGAQISALQRRLALAEFSHDHVGVVLEVFVAGTGIHQGASGKIVAASVVAAEFAVGLLPSPSGSRRRRQCRH